MTTQSNWLSPDGYRYGVAFADNSVLEVWNGKTQRRHAELFAAWARVTYAPDNIRPVRTVNGVVWKEYHDA